MGRKGKHIVHGALLLALGLLLAAASGNVSAAGRKPGKRVWSNAPCQYGAGGAGLVSGISANKDLLVSCETNRSPRDCSEVDWTNCLPELILHRGSDGTEISRNLLHEWGAFLDANKSRLYPSFCSSGSAGDDTLFPAFWPLGPRTVLAVQVPWLTVVDLQTGSIVRSVLPSPDLTDRQSPGLHVPISNPIPMIVAVSPHATQVAVASNIGKGPRVFIFNSDLTKQVGSWAIPRFVEDLAWSPEGKRLGVLYDGKFDAKGKFVGEFPGLMPVRLPDVDVFKVASKVKLASFFTGGPEAEIKFSPDGSLIYAISEKSNVTTLQRDAIRAFSSASGKLVRVLSPNGPQVHDEFAISPDGRFIAANASTPRWHPFWSEPSAFGNITRVVVLDAETGQVIFQHERRVDLDVPLNPIFILGGRLLLVEYGPRRSMRRKQLYRISIVAYSMAGL